jgi:hypothetical protein
VGIKLMLSVETQKIKVSINVKKIANPEIQKK